jgi:Mlc titration factor MtfA (ptsG expression regulator)
MESIMIFARLLEHRRRHILEQPFPDEWLRYIEKNMAHYALLTGEEQQRLRQDVQVFVAEKYWEGCNGLEVTDEMRVTIAAQACLLILNLKHHDYYPNMRSVLIYPNDYVAPAREVAPGGVVSESLSDRLGEAWEHGPVILSWADVVQGGQNSRDGHNVVLHEFAHKLDMLNPTATGVPELDEDADYDRWAEVMSREYQALVEQTERGNRSLLDPYGATNAAEFFAVATEAFFEKSRRMQETHSTLYGVLRDFYHQDPAARLP